jgi:hypothetical protein
LSRKTISLLPVVTEKHAETAETIDTNELRIVASAKDEKERLISGGSV